MAPVMHQWPCLLAILVSAKAEVQLYYNFDVTSFPVNPVIPADVSGYDLSVTEDGAGSNEAFAQQLSYHFVSALVDSQLYLTKGSEVRMRKISFNHCLISPQFCEGTTVTFWLKLISFQSGSAFNLISRTANGPTPTQSGYLIKLDPSGENLQVYVQHVPQTGIANYYFTEISAADLYNNNKFIAISWTKNVGINIYVDGTKQPPSSTPITTTKADVSPQTVQIVLHFGNTRGPEMYLDEYKFYNEALDDAAVLAAYNAYLPATTVFDRTTVSDTTETTTVADTTKSTTVSDTTTPTTVADTTKPTIVADTTKSTTVPETIKSTTLSITTKLKTVLDTTKPTTLPNTTKPTTLPNTTKPTTVLSSNNSTTEELTSTSAECRLIDKLWFRIVIAVVSVVLLLLLIGTTVCCCLICRNKRYKA